MRDSFLPLTTEERLHWMRRSIDVGKQSVAEAARKPSVGVVIVRNGVLIGESYRGEHGAGVHAEAGLLMVLEEQGVKVEGATVFTTLEPCSCRNPPKIPCAERLVGARVAAAVIGMYDPNPRVYRTGWKILRDAGVLLFDYPDDLRNEIEADNAMFIDVYESAEGKTGSAEFDYSRNDGRFTLRHEDLEILLRFGNRGADSVWATDHSQHVAELRHARTFQEVDNPGSYDWSRYSVGAYEGAIVAFRNERCYALVKVTKVFAGQERGNDHIAVQFDWELRER